MSKSKKPGSNERVDRRGFLRGAAGAAAGSAVFAAQAPLAKPQQADARSSPAEATSAVEAKDNVKPGSDFMIDVIKTLGIEYCAANPGSSFRALHESMINYGGNSMPELLTCCHEEQSAAMAHGYAKIEGKPMMIMAHGTVGLQHASMGIYNAYADRVPVYIVLGNILDVNYRRGSCRVGTQRARCGRHGPRVREVGRHAGDAHAFRRVRGARL